MSQYKLDPGLLSVKACAEIADLQPQSIRAAILSGRLRAEKLGRDWIVARVDLDVFLASNRKPGPKAKR
jgi:hypothetical protein